jgi:CRP/FNR family transcriptional regulator
VGGPLDGVTAEAAAAIDQAGVRRAVAAGRTLFHEGEAPRALAIVVDGRLKLVKHSEDGRAVVVAIAMPGDVVGGVAAFGRRPHTCSAVALAPTVVLEVAGDAFAAIMQRHPDVARHLLADVIEQLTDAHDTMKSLAVDRVDRRIARQLLKLSRRAGQPTPAGVAIHVPLARQDVADLAGTTVETAIRVLSRWRKRGAIRTEGARLVLVDVPYLQAVAGSDEA